jgi:hypothetical protein
LVLGVVRDGGAAVSVSTLDELPLEVRDEAVRVVEDAIDASSETQFGLHYIPTARTGRAIVAAMLEAGWTAPEGVS